MSAQVELAPLGFIVTDDFGPEGRRPVVALVDGDCCPYVFPSRVEAKMYAKLRDDHARIYATEGYSDSENEARETAKAYAIERGRTFSTYTVDSGWRGGCDCFGLSGTMAHVTGCPNS